MPARTRRKTRNGCSNIKKNLGAVARMRAKDSWLQEKLNEVLFDRLEFQEALKLADAGGVAHFPQGLGFDLANALAGDIELFADFLEGAGIAVTEAEAQFQYAALAGIETGKHV